MKTAEFRLIDANLPKQNYFTFAELAESTGYSVQFWKRLWRNGELRALQPHAGRQGSIVRVPRSSVIDCLGRMVR